MTSFVLLLIGNLNSGLYLEMMVILNDIWILHHSKVSLIAHSLHIKPEVTMF